MCNWGISELTKGISSITRIYRGFKVPGVVTLGLKDIKWYLGGSWIFQVVFQYHIEQREERSILSNQGPLNKKRSGKPLKKKGNIQTSGKLEV